MKKEDFIPGKWYRSTPEANNRGGEIYYGKFLEFRGDAFIASSSRVTGMISTATYNFNSGYIWEPLTDLTEIQDLLPNNHPDKIMKTATISTSPAYVRCTHSHDNRFKKGKVYKTHPGVYKQGNVYIKPEIDSPISDYPLIGGYWKFEPCEGPETSETEVFGKFIIGDIVVSLRNTKPYREEGDMFRVLPNSKQGFLYYKPSTHSQDPDDWRLATTKECDAFNNGVKNIKQLEAPKETVVKQTSFLTDEYIVTLTDISASFPKNHVFKQRENTDYLRVYKDIRGEANGNTIADFNTRSLWRYATKQEIMEYDIQGKPIDVTKIGMRPDANVIPSNVKRWAVKRTVANYKVLNEWANKQGGYGHSSSGGWMHSINYGINGHSGHGHFYADDTKHPDHTEISFETFEREYLKSTLNTNVEPVITKTMNTESSTSPLPPQWYMLVDRVTKFDAELWRWDGNPKNYELEIGQLVGVPEYGGKGHNPGKSTGIFGKELSYSEFKRLIMTPDERKRLLTIKYPIGSCVVVTKENGGYNGKENYCYKVLSITATTDDPSLMFSSINGLGIRQLGIRQATAEETARYEREGKPYDTKVSEVSNTVAMTPDGQPITNDPYAGKSIEEMLVICRQMFPKGCTYRKKGELVVHLLDQELIIQSAGNIANNERGISNIGLPWFFYNGTMRVELVQYTKQDDGFIPVNTTTVIKTLKDLPKKATLSDVSALVKHQEPVIAFSKKAKRSKLVIINK